MKAIKFKRSCSGWHWSQAISENIVYIPELKVIIYSGNMGAGVIKKTPLLSDIKNYIQKVKNGEVKKFENDEVIENLIKKGFVRWDNESNKYESRAVTQEEIDKNPEVKRRFMEPLNLSLYRYDLGGATFESYREVDLKLSAKDINDLLRDNQEIEAAKKHIIKHENKVKKILTKK